MKFKQENPEVKGRDEKGKEMKRVTKSSIYFNKDTMR